MIFLIMLLVGRFLKLFYKLASWGFEIWVQWRNSSLPRGCKNNVDKKFTWNLSL